MNKINNKLDQRIQQIIKILLTLSITITIIWIILSSIESNIYNNQILKTKILEIDLLLFFVLLILFSIPIIRTIVMTVTFVQEKNYINGLSGLIILTLVIGLVTIITSN